ncbi:MAG: cell division protein FtsL [bacterium]|nr:cell division protein FtsL [bacterium]
MKDYPSFGRPTSSRLVRKSSGTRKRGSLRMLLAWALLFGVAFYFVQQRVEFIRTERRIKTLMKEKQKLLAEILPLKLEETYLTRISRVEARATVMGLERPGEWQKFTLAPPVPPAAAPVEAELLETPADTSAAAEE